jgi:hypothetical protein
LSTFMYMRFDVKITAAILSLESQVHATGRFK